jgi:hypothetical protein
VEPTPPPPPHPLDYGGLADRAADARQRRFRGWAVVGVCWAAAMLAFYGLTWQWSWRDNEMPFAIVIAGAGLLPMLLLVAGCAGTFVPARWARLCVLLGGYGVVGGSIVQMMAYLAAGSMFGGFAYWGVLAVVVQLTMAAGFLYVFHDEGAEDFFRG